MNRPHAPTVSLIIPAYNEEKYIADCASGQFCEILVIDNASTDKTAEIASSFPGVRVVREEKKGLTTARQRGFLESKGDILAFVDADTRMKQYWPSTIVREFSESDALVCLSGPYVYHDTPLFQQFITKWFYWYLMAMPTYYVLGYMAVGGNFAVRKDVVKKIGGFDTSIAFYGEDTDIARRASEHGKVKFMPTLVMPTSGRRLAGEGFIRTAVIYILNFLSEALFKRPYTRTYKDIR
jgi:glycosyltransferase involved in cell wall biosynthesis